MTGKKRFIKIGPNSVRKDLNFRSENNSPRDDHKYEKKPSPIWNYKQVRNSLDLMNSSTQNLNYNYSKFLDQNQTDGLYADDTTSEKRGGGHIRSTSLGADLKLVTA